MILPKVFHNRLFFRISLLAVLAAASVYFFKKPRPYWDMLPYMGCVLSLDNNDSNFVHRETYSAFRKYASAEMTASMIDGHPYCRTLATNADYFHQHLPFFHAKPFYVYTSRAFWKCGVPLFYAVLLPVLIAFVITGWLIYRWLEKYLLPAFAFGITILLLACSFNLGAFRIASPDALAGLFLLAGSYFILERRQVQVAVLLFLFAIFTRIDSFLFVVPFLFFLSWLYWRTDRKILFSCITGIFASALLFGLIRYQANYDASRMFYRAFVDLVPNPYDIDPQFNTTDYFAGIKKGLSDSARSISVFLLPLLMILYAAFFRVRLRSVEGAWLAALFISLCGRLILHPAFEDRYLFAHLDTLIILIIAGAVTKARLSSKAAAV